MLDDNGVGQDSYVISGIQTAITLKDTYNIRVINLSLGRTLSTPSTISIAWRAIGLVPQGSY